jgi:hypothetical protein
MLLSCYVRARTFYGRLDHLLNCLRILPRLLLNYPTPVQRNKGTGLDTLQHIEPLRFCSNFKFQRHEAANTLLIQLVNAGQDVLHNLAKVQEYTRQIGLGLT